MNTIMMQRAALVVLAGFVLAYPAVLLATDDVHSIYLVSKPYEVKSGVFDGGKWYGLTQQDDPALVKFERGRHPIYEDGEIVRSVAIRPLQQEPAFKTLITSPTNTPWMRIRFSDFELGEQSYIILTSIKDGDWQYFDRYYLGIYSNTSGVFSGGEVELALYLAPQDAGIFINVSEVLVAAPADFADFDAEPLPPGDGGIASICGDLDDRVSSNDSRCGRLFFGGCTGWLVHNGAALTAGHCGDPDGNLGGVILEFNVPSSSSTGVPNQALLNDQYPVMNVIAFESDGEGEDYNVFSVGRNSNTGLRPHIAQGFYHMTGVVPSEGTSVRVTGYGVDNRPPGPSGACCSRDVNDNCTHTNCNSANLTQQTDTGSCDDCLVGTAIEHTVDTEPANSGSPILWNSLDIAIAIHAQGGCDSFWSDYDNAGTWLGYAPLGQTLNSFLGPNTVWVNAVTFPLNTGTALLPFRSVAGAVGAVPNGGQVAIVEGSYPASAGNTFTAGADGKAMTLMAPVGTATIGN